VVPPEVESYVASRRDDAGQRRESRLEIEKLHRRGSQRRNRMEIVLGGTVQTHGEEFRRASGQIRARDVEHRF